MNFGNIDLGDEVRNAVEGIRADLGESVHASVTARVRSSTQTAEPRVGWEVYISRRGVGGPESFKSSDDLAGAVRGAVEAYRKAAHPITADGDGHEGRAGHEGEAAGR